MNDVSLVITSCGRFDLLERTLDSFFKYNTYPIKEVIITEDSTEGKKLEKLVSKYKDQNFEDDWEFLREGFIEKSMEMLKEDPKIAVVGLRSREDCSGIPISKENYMASNGEEYFEILEDVFTYNPGLRRKDVCDLFGSHEKLEGKLWEAELSKFYKDRGFKMISFVNPFVEHIGNKRHVHFSKRGKNSVLDFKIDRMVKKIRYTFLKLFGKVK